MKLIKCERVVLCFGLMVLSTCISVEGQNATGDNTASNNAASNNRGSDRTLSHNSVNTSSPETSSPAASEGSTKKVATSATDATPTIEATSAEPKSTGVTENSAPAPKPQASTQDEWQFQFTPYIWIVGISGRAGIGNLTVDVDSGLGADNVHLNFGFMGTFEARKDRFIVLTDLQYSNLGTERPTPGPLFSSATADFKTFILDPEVGYRVAQNPAKGRFLDVLAGVRYYHLRTDLNFGAGILSARSATASRDWVDVVGGVRGRVHLTPKIFLVGKADVGGGGSKVAFQLFGGVGVQVSKSIVLLGGYRDLDINYNRNNFLFDGALSGPIFGIGFKF